MAVEMIALAEETLKKLKTMFNLDAHKRQSFRGTSTAVYIPTSGAWVSAIVK